MADIDEVARLREEALDSGLVHADRLRGYSAEQLAAIYNGVGPDRWPVVAREMLTWLLRDVLAAVLVHDVDYVIGGGMDDFRAANAALNINVRRLARRKYGWWRPRRWFLMELAPMLEEWTNRYGQEGWNWVQASL